MNEEIFYRKNSTGHLFAMCSPNGWHIEVTNHNGLENINFRDWAVTDSVFSQPATKQEFCDAYNAVYYKLTNKVMQ